MMIKLTETLPRMRLKTAKNFADALSIIIFLLSEAPRHCNYMRAFITTELSGAAYGTAFVTKLNSALRPLERLVI